MSNTELATRPHIWPFGKLSDYETAEDHEAAWLKWRDKDYGIGSSDAGVICQVAPKSWGSRLQLSLRKRGLIPPKPTEDFMIVGHLMEPVIAALYQLRAGCDWAAEQIPCEHPERRWMKATIDRLTTTGKIVELKWASRFTPHSFGEDGDSDSLPHAFLLQCQHQMDCYGAMECDVAVFIDGEVRIYPVARNQDLIDQIVRLETDFRNDMIDGIDPEELVASDADVLNQLFHECEGTIDLDDADTEAADIYDRLKDDIKILEDLRAAAKARLMLSFGDMKYGETTDGRVVVRGHWIVKANPCPAPKAAYPVTKFSFKKGSSK